MKKNTKTISVIAATLAIVLSAFVFSKKHRPDPQPVQIVAKDYGWRELVSDPIPVVCGDKDVGGLYRIEFRNNDTESMVALVYNNPKDGKLSLKNRWKKGGEVYTISVPGKGLQHEPIPMYLAIDYRNSAVQ